MRDEEQPVGVRAGFGKCGCVQEKEYCDCEEA